MKNTLNAFILSAIGMLGGCVALPLVGPAMTGGGAVMLMQSVDACALASASLEKKGYSDTAPGVWEKTEGNRGETIFLVCGAKLYEIKAKLDEKNTEWNKAHPRRVVTARGDATESEFFVDAIARFVGSGDMVAEKIYWRTKR